MKTRNRARRCILQITSACTNQNLQANVKRKTTILEQSFFSISLSRPSSFSSNLHIERQEKGKKRISRRTEKEKKKLFFRCGRWWWFIVVVNQQFQFEYKDFFRHFIIWLSFHWFTIFLFVSI